MSLCRTLSLCLIALPLLAAGSGMAADMSGRLVAGGASGVKADVPQGDSLHLGGLESRAPLLSLGGFTLGAAAEPGRGVDSLALPYASGRGNLAVGGYVSYGLNEARVSSSLRAGSSALYADVSAAYGGSLLGSDNTAAFSLGAAVGRSQAFSPNPLQLGLTLPDTQRAVSDFNMSFRLSHQVTPSFSFGGVAQANRPAGVDSTVAPGFMLGAGMGYRF